MSDPASSGSPINVACCQVALAIGDVAGNRARVRSAVLAAAGAGGQVVVVPELANTGYMFADLAEPVWSGVRYVAVHAVGGSPPHVVDVAAGVEAAVASLVEHRRYLEALSDEPVEEQARRQVDMSTLTEDGDRRVGFRLFWG